MITPPRSASASGGELAPPTPSSLHGKAPNPRRSFASPELLMADESLSDGDKQALLEDWAMEVERRLGSEGEGLGQSAPLRSDQEARLADEAARVRSALTALKLAAEDR